MSLAGILNLSKPGLAAIVLLGSAAVVGFSVYALQYNPAVREACTPDVIVPETDENLPFVRALAIYLQQTRNWSSADYCIDKNAVKGNERIVSVRRRGIRVGGGEGFQVRMSPDLRVLGELPHD